MMYIVAATGIVVAILLALLRAVRGPTTFDRILAVNAMGTLTVLLIAVAGFLTGRPEWLDLALIYALLNFVGTLAVLKFIRYRNLGLEGGLERRQREEMFPWKPSK